MPTLTYARYEIDDIRLLQTESHNRTELFLYAFEYLYRQLENEQRVRTMGSQDIGL